MDNMFGGWHGMPGLDAAEFETVAELLWKKDQGSWIMSGGMLMSTTVDAGNTPTTELRPGLLLGRVTATQKLNVWNPTAVDGTEFIWGVLMIGHAMSPFGTALDKWSGPVLIGGCLKAASIVIPGQAAAGISGKALEHLVRNQLFGRFVLDDNFNSGLAATWRTIQAKTADYTITEADNGTLFTNRGAGGAVNFTLPATAEKMLRYGVYVAADQSVTVTAGTADTMVVFNDAAADSVALSTAGDKVGALIEIIGDGTGWLVIPHTWADGVIVQTLTIAT